MPLPKLGAGFVEPTAINDRGDVAGVNAVLPDGNNQHALLWTR